MGKDTRKRYSGEFKSWVVLEAIGDLGQNTRPLASLNLGLLDPFVQRMRRTAAQLWHDLRGKLLHRISHQTFLLGK